jgi:hypothetical protein
MKRSIDPIGVPFCSSVARSRPYGGCCVSVERCHFEWREKLGEGETILHGMPALTHTVIKFRPVMLARIIHERFCSNRRAAAATSLRLAGSPIGPSPYCTSTHRVLRAQRNGLATRLSDFATNRHE